MATGTGLLDQVEADRALRRLRPQMVIRAVSDLMADNAVISLDCGANTHFAGALHPAAREPAASPAPACWRRWRPGLSYRDRRATGLSRPAIRGDRRRWRLRHADGGADHGRGARSADQDHTAEEQCACRGDVRAARDRQPELRLRACRRSISSLSPRHVAPRGSVASGRRKCVRPFRPRLPRRRPPWSRRWSIPRRSPPSPMSCGT